MPVYNPQEDSYILSKVLNDKVLKLKPKKILDMGSGSGIQVQTLIDLGITPKTITLVDIDKEAVDKLKKQFPKSKVIHSNLFNNVKGKCDLIIFNPPYLSQDKHDKGLDTTGGKKGSEIINRFLTQASKCLNTNARIFLLTSSLTKGLDFKKYHKKLIGEKKLFFEELYVWNYG
jgi:release factor glutamine methyltransferase